MTSREEHTIVNSHPNNPRSGSSHFRCCSLASKQNFPQSTATYAGALSSHLFLYPISKSFSFSPFPKEKQNSKHSMLYEENNNVKSPSERCVLDVGFLPRMFDL